MVNLVNSNIAYFTTSAEVGGFTISRPFSFLNWVVFLWLSLKSFQRCIQAAKKMGDSFILSMIGGCNPKNLGGLRFLPSPEYRIVAFH